MRDNSPEFKAAGLPSGGGYATARGMAAFYQMLGNGGRLGTVRLFSPRLLSYVARNHTGESPDHAMTSGWPTPWPALNWIRRTASGKLGTSRMYALHLARPHLKSDTSQRR